jgi:hypothetical protein
MREKRTLKRAREKISNKAPREPIDTNASMANGVKNDFQSFITLARGRGVVC